MTTTNAPLEVNSILLTNKAEELDGLKLTIPPGQTNAPDGTPTIADRAIQTLNSNARVVQSHIKAAECERERLADSLRAAAAAYVTANSNTAAAIKDGRPVDGPVPVDTSNIQKSSEVEGPTACYQQPSYGHTPVEVNAQQIELVKRLDDFRGAWSTFNGSLAEYAEAFKKPGGWSGPAADACANAMDTHHQWVKNVLVKACKDIEDQADKLQGAHEDAAKTHPKSDDVEKVLKELYASHGIFDSGITTMAYMKVYEAMQHQSDETMTKYAGDASITDVEISKPPAIGALPPVDRKSPTGGPGAPGGGGGAPGGGAPLSWIAALSSAPIMIAKPRKNA